MFDERESKIDDLMDRKDVGFGVEMKKVLVLVLEVFRASSLSDLRMAINGGALQYLI